MCMFVNLKNIQVLFRGARLQRALARRRRAPTGSDQRGARWQGALAPQRATRSSIPEGCFLVMRTGARRVPQGHDQTP